MSVNIANCSPTQNDQISLLKDMAQKVLNDQPRLIIEDDNCEEPQPTSQSEPHQKQSSSSEAESNNNPDVTDVKVISEPANKTYKYVIVPPSVEFNGLHESDDDDVVILYENSNVKAKISKSQSSQSKLASKSKEISKNTSQHSTQEISSEIIASDAEKAGKPDKAKKIKKAETADKAEKIDKPEKINKHDKIDKRDKIDKHEKIDKPGKIDKPEKMKVVATQPTDVAKLTSKTLASAEPPAALEDCHDAAKNLSKLVKEMLSSDKMHAPLPVRPMADVLLDIGVDNVRLYTCRDQIQHLEELPAEEVNESVKENLSKLKEAEKRLSVRFKPYAVPCKRCRCQFQCYLHVGITYHKRIGRSMPNGWFRCCFCSKFKTRSTTTYVDHLCDEHSVRGTTEPSIKHMCSFCSYENRDLRRAVMHELKCKTRFSAARNLAVPVTLLDMPIFSKISTVTRSVPTGTFTHPAIPQLNSKVQYNPFHMVPPNRPAAIQNPMLYMQPTAPKGVDSMRPLSMQQIHEVALAAVAQAQMQMGLIMKPMTSSSLDRAAPSASTEFKSKAFQKTSLTSSGPACEICNASVMSLEALLKHMQLAHQINIKSIDFFLRGKAFVCKTCFQGFWTQMGLTRHHQQAHNKPSHSCFICGPIGGADILTHLVSRHAISLQDMLSVGWCYMCKAEVKTPEKFTNHMLSAHPDLFPNKMILEAMVNLFLNQKKNDAAPKVGSPAKVFVKVNVAAPALKPTLKTAGQKSAANVSSAQISFKRTKHRCETCQLKFESEPALRAHYQELHTVLCTRCDEKYTSVEAMLKHFNQKHYNEKDACVICKEQVKIGVPMIRHMKRMHLKKCSVIINRLPPSLRMKHIQKLKHCSDASPPRLNLLLPPTPTTVQSNISISTLPSFTQPKIVIPNCDVKPKK